MSYTLEEINASLARWKKALDACATGKSYTIGDRSLTMHDLPEIRKTIEWLEQRRSQIMGRASTVYVKPKFRR